MSHSESVSIIFKCG